ncbi:MAG TPA: nucleotide exchange factor GrpE [Lacisediminihabitans sp.]|uniref:nucleotide exchange factor GrpE n=1 Tax=Lacisediminihabitans sp. TaxID=2787631 RepID=UPI002EDAE805
MTDDKTPIGDEGEPEEELVSAEGPDVETSFSDEDLAFLAGGESGDATADDASDSTVDPAVEILGDLKRVQAEFANYRKRVERDREANRELNIAEVVKALLPVLDDLALAEAHGDLAEGPMSVIAQKLRASLEKFGLTPIGAKGDVFDPHLHEALVQLPTPDVTVNTVADVVAPGYLLGERLLRPAKVAVSVPAE